MAIELYELTHILLESDNYHKRATHRETVTTNKERRFNCNNDKMQQN